MFRNHPERLLPLVGLLVLAGCGDRDPSLRTDVWRPLGSNAGNIAAQVANPHDLVQGRGSTVSDTKASSIAVQHIFENQPQPLSYGGSAGGSSGGSSGGGSGGGGGAASGAASALTPPGG